MALPLDLALAFTEFRKDLQDEAVDLSTWIAYGRLMKSVEDYVANNKQPTPINISPAGYEWIVVCDEDGQWTVTTRKTDEA
jgi:hypothetical protein